MHYSVLLNLLFPLAAFAADLSFVIPSTSLLPNPLQLLSSTSATLARLGQSNTVLLNRRNTFDFKDLETGSYLFTVACRDFAFPPLRVDVSSVVVEGQQFEQIDVWQTFWGNEWSNKGERRGGGVAKGSKPIMVQIQPTALKDYYMARSGFAILDMLKSPMILIALVSLVLIAGLPYLMENMDEETKAEFETMSAKSPLAAARSPNAANFDLAGWMAGKTVSSETGSGSQR